MFTKVWEEKEKIKGVYKCMSVFEYLDVEF